MSYIIAYLLVGGIFLIIVQAAASQEHQSERITYKLGFVELVIYAAILVFWPVLIISMLYGKLLDSQAEEV